MELKKILGAMVVFSCIALSNTAQASCEDMYRENPYFRTDSRYDYMYANPPRQSLGVAGRYIISTSGTRYVHSPSRLKGVRHAARINANNRFAYGY